MPTPLRTLLTRLAAIRAGEEYDAYSQGANVIGQKFHLAHPDGVLLATLKEVADQAPELLAEITPSAPAVAAEIVTPA